MFTDDMSHLEGHSYNVEMVSGLLV